ncbi:MAG: hypothetical protein PGN07_09590 [Aeromicrobium erythreum]
MHRLNPRWSAVVQLTGGLALLLWGLLRGSIVPTDFVVRGTAGPTDQRLYESIVRAMQGDAARDGVGYYAAVAREQIAVGAPTSPVPTVREPTLAWILATVGEKGAMVLLAGLVLIGFLLAMRRLEKLTTSRWEWYPATIVVGLSLLTALLVDRLWFHEVWAGVLVLTALLLVWSRWWVAALPVALLAVAIREMAVVVPIACFLVALRSRRRAEATGWAGVLVLSAGFYAWHAWQVHEHVPARATGPGWTGLQGWPFVVNASWFSSLLWAAPVAVAAAATVVALLGWLGPLGRELPQGTLALAILFVAVGLGGRPDNLYWGALWTPLLALGLVPGLRRSVILAGRLVRSADSGPAVARSA